MVGGTELFVFVFCYFILWHAVVRVFVCVCSVRACFGLSSMETSEREREREAGGIYYKSVVDTRTSCDRNFDGRETG